MNKEKKIVVIGSGFGGIAAALRMRAKGYQVTLLEKHPDLGGRARVFKKPTNATKIESNYYKLNKTKITYSGKRLKK